MGTKTDGLAQHIWSRNGIIFPLTCEGLGKPKQTGPGKCHSNVYQKSFWLSEKHFVARNWYKPWQTINGLGDEQQLTCRLNCKSSNLELYSKTTENQWDVLAHLDLHAWWYGMLGSEVGFGFHYRSHGRVRRIHQGVLNAWTCACQHY